MLSETLCVFCDGGLTCITVDCRKRKLTDKSLPQTILQSSDFPDSKFYQQLLDMEKKLDWTMSRKRAEVQDTLGKPSQVRVFLSLLSSVE